MTLAVELGVQRDQGRREVRWRHGLAAMRADRGVIEAVVTLDRVARAGGAAALVAVEATSEEPAALRLHEIAAHGRDGADLRRRDRARGFGEYRDAVRQLPPDLRERDAGANLERAVLRGADASKLRDVRERDEARR